MSGIGKKLLLFIKKYGLRVLVYIPFLLLAALFLVVAAATLSVYIELWVNPNILPSGIGLYIAAERLPAALLCQVIVWTALTIWCCFPARGWWALWHWVWLFFTARAAGSIANLWYGLYAYTACDGMWPGGCEFWLGAVAFLWGLLALGIMYLKPPLRKWALWIFIACWTLYAVIVYRIL